jgi:hypothetical protein
MNIQTLLSKVYQQPRRRSLQVKARLPWALAFAGIVAVVCTIELIARGAFAVDGPKRMEEIKANRFVVVDESGKTTAEFGVLSDGRPGLAVWDNKTNLVAVLSIDDGGPRFSFQNKTGVSLLSTTAPFGHRLSRRHEGRSSMLIPLAASLVIVLFR